MKMGRKQLGNVETDNKYEMARDQEAGVGPV